MSWAYLLFDLELTSTWYSSKYPFLLEADNHDNVGEI